MNPSVNPNPTKSKTHPNMKVMNHPMPRKLGFVRRNKFSKSSRSQAENSPNAERNYERYLVLARAQALTGDRVAAENYFQHAEHYFRSMENGAD
jgi:hypothetical protein